MRLPAARHHRRQTLLWIGLILAVNGVQAAAVLWHIHGMHEPPIVLRSVLVRQRRPRVPAGADLGGHAHSTAPDV
jgi:hypothetical protein